MSRKPLRNPSDKHSEKRKTDKGDASKGLDPSPKTKFTKKQHGQGEPDPVSPPNVPDARKDLDSYQTNDVTPCIHPSLGLCTAALLSLLLGARFRVAEGEALEVRLLSGAFEGLARHDSVDF
jgi:hypothetical protein